MRRFPEKGKLSGLIFKVLTRILALTACCVLACGLLVAALGFFPKLEAPEVREPGGV